MNFKLFSLNFIRILKDRTLIILLAIFFISSIILQIVSSQKFLNKDYLISSIATSFFMIFYLKVLIDLLFISIISIFITAKLFANDQKEGRMSLEIKGGISIKEVYFFRILIIIFYYIFIISILLLIEGPIILMIPNTFKEMRIFSIANFGFYFLFGIMMSSLSLFGISVLKTKIAIVSAGILTTISINSNQLGSAFAASSNREFSNYLVEDNIYEKNNLIYSWNFNNDILNDSYFNSLIDGFYNWNNFYKEEDVDMLNYGNFAYLQSIGLIESKLGEKFNAFINDMDKLFEENYSQFYKGNSEGFDIKDIFTIRHDLSFISISDLNSDYFYNIIDKISELNTNANYNNLLNILKKYSKDFVKNYYLYFNEKLFGDWKIPLPINYYPEEGGKPSKWIYFENTVKKYKTSDQLDFYYFIAQNFYMIYRWENYSNDSSTIEQFLNTNNKTLKNFIKTQNYINPFLQFSQLQFGNYFSKSNEYNIIFNNFSSWLKMLPTTFLNVTTSTDYDNQKPRLQNLSLENKNYVNYFGLYIVYLLIFLAIYFISFLFFKKRID